MRRLFALLLLALLAAAALAWLVRLDPGYVLLQFRGTQVETSLWFALLALCAALALGWAVARLIGLGARLLARIGGTPSPAAGRAGDATSRGIVAFFEGRWEQAARLLARGARRSPHPLVNHLLAARAAAASGDTELARGFLRLAAELPGSEAAVRVETARLQLQDGDAAGARATLETQAGAQVPAALGMLLEILPQEGDPAAAVALLGEARRLRVLDAEAIDGIEAECFLRRLAQPGLTLQALRDAWDALPARLRHRGALAAECAYALARFGAAAEGLAHLEAALKREWSPEAVRALGLVLGEEPSRQFARAESLLAAHPQDPVLLLALGRLARAARLWGKARDYLQASLARQESRETCIELARACEELGEAARARALREQALEMP